MSKVTYKDGVPQQKDVLTENSVVQEKDAWENTIYLIDEQDYVHGGVDGYDNIPHQQLANRTKFLKTTCDKLRKDLTDFQNAVKSQDGKNTQEFLDIRNIASNIRSDLDALKNHVSLQDSKNQSLINDLRKDVNKLMYDMTHHTHKYAGSDTIGGDANTIKVLVDNANKILLSGVTSGNPNKMYHTSNVFVQGDDITATKFHGDLDGTATKATKLSKKSQISYYGDVIGSYMFDGTDNNYSVHLSLNTIGSFAGTYGDNKARKLKMNESFLVPRIIINNKGLITGIENRTLTLPDEAVSGTTNATQKNGKLYLVGGEHQNQKEYTYSNNKAYMIDGKLYSNDKPVITTSDSQALTNKTYEGYTLREACSRDVETNIQGVNGSNKLVTSNALYNHTHNYAGSDKSGGDAYTVKIYKNDTDKRYLTINQGKNGKLEYNSYAYIQKNDLCAPVIHATDMMHIPGGRVWIDTSVDAVDGSTFNPQTLAEIAQMQLDIKQLKAVNAIGAHKARMAMGSSCKKGDILYYSSGGYKLADNGNKLTATKIVIALSDSDTTRTTLVSQSYALPTTDSTHNGYVVYLGKNGKTTYTMPSTTGEIIKELGYMEGNTFMFNGTSTAVINN